MLPAEVEIPLLTDRTPYDVGYECGYLDMALIVRPKRSWNTNNTDRDTSTYDDYLRVKSEIERAVYNFNPTEWQRGYADGSDEKAIEVGHGVDGKCPDCGNHLRAGSTCRECGFVSEEPVKY